MFELNRYKQLQAKRSPWESHWQECVDNVLPRRGDISFRSTPGQKRTSRIYDTTATNSLELLAAAIHGMLTNPSTKWFDLVTNDPRLMDDWDVRTWLEKVTNIMLGVYASSNFTTQTHELYLDLGLIGTGALYQEEGGKDEIIRFTTHHISGLFIVENQMGLVDTVYRRDWMTAQNICRMWPDTAPESVRDKLKKDPDEELEILHIVRPRDDRLPDKSDSKNLPFSSRYIEVQNKVELSEGGYNEFPYAVPRWYLTTGEVYGRSPAMTALPDIKMLNEMCKCTIRAAQKVVDPPLQVPDDGFMSEINTYPGGINRYNAGSPDDRIYALDTKGRPELGLEMEEQRRIAIRRVFYVDQFRLPSSPNPQMTATEVMERTQENLRLMGPILGRLQPEYLTPTITRSYGILKRKNFFPPTPKQLSGTGISIKYVSPIARAQRASELQGIAKTIDFVAALGDRHQEVWDEFNIPSTARLVAEINGAPASTLNSPETVAEIRRVRSEAQAEQEEQAKLMQAAESAGKAAPALKAIGGLGEMAANSGAMGVEGEQAI
jgi:hypothetical protein